jgi:hypothetical protein
MIKRRVRGGLNDSAEARGGLDDSTGSREVDDGVGSREIFSGKFWQPHDMSESLQGLGFARATQ